MIKYESRRNATRRVMMRRVSSLPDLHPRRSYHHDIANGDFLYNDVV